MWKHHLCIFTASKKSFFNRLCDLNVRNDVILVVVKIGGLFLGLSSVELLQLGLAQVVDDAGADGVAHHVQHGPEAIEKPVNGKD